jgi:hypothetical protein
MKTNRCQHGIFLVIAICSACLSQLSAQSVADPTTLPAMKPGTPAGSYALSGFDTIDLYSGKINWAIPLRTIGARGKSGYQMVLPIQQSWVTELQAPPTILISQFLIIVVCFKVPILDTNLAP